MPDDVTLASGRVLALEAPSIRRVLATCTLTGGRLCARDFADMCLDRSAVKVDELELRDAGDVLFVALWGIGELADDDEAVTFATLCERYGELPSRRAGIVDAVVAYEFDLTLTIALQRARDESEEDGERRHRGFRASAPTDGAAWFPRAKEE